MKGHLRNKKLKLTPVRKERMGLTSRTLDSRLKKKGVRTQKRRMVVRDRN
jgi:hypothetical protein